MKLCVSCGNPIDSDFYKITYKTKCLNCYKKEKYKGYGDQKQRIRGLLKKYSSK